MNVLSFFSAIGVGNVMRQLIAQAMSGGSLVDMAKSILTKDNIATLEGYAEQIFPKVAPELKLAAGIVAAYDHDKTKWLQQALKAILGIDLAVDGIYGPATIAAVEQFQGMSLGLKVDGFAYRITTPLIEAALARLLSKPVTAAAIGAQTAMLAPSQVSTPTA